MSPYRLARVSPSCFRSASSSSPSVAARASIRIRFPATCTNWPLGLNAVPLPWATWDRCSSRALIREVSALDFDPVLRRPSCSGTWPRADALFSANVSAPGVNTRIRMRPMQVTKILFMVDTCDRYGTQGQGPKWLLPCRQNQSSIVAGWPENAVSPLTICWRADLTKYRQRPGRQCPNTGVRL